MTVTRIGADLFDANNERESWGRRDLDEAALDAALAQEERGRRSSTAAEFLALDITPPRMLVEGHLPEASIGWIVGQPKSFKSFYAQDLAFALSTGGLFLGRYPANGLQEGRRVLFVQLESSKAAFQNRIRSMASRYKAQPENLFLLSNEPLTLEDEKSRERIAAELEHVKPDLLILDPLAAITTGEENSATEMGNVVRWLRGWRDQYGCAILVVHHANKAAQTATGGRAGLKMRGSGVLYAASEVTISVERPDDDAPRVHVRVELKEGEGPKPYVCEFNPVGSEIRVVADTIRSHVSDDDLVAFIKSQKSGATRSDVIEHFEIPYRTLTEHLKRLEGKRIWRMPGTGVGPEPAIYLTDRSQIRVANS